MAEIIHEILELNVLVDQHRPPPPPRLVKAKHNILLLRNSYLFKIPNSHFFHTQEKSTLKARATSM